MLGFLVSFYQTLKTLLSFDKNNTTATNNNTNNAVDMTAETTTGVSNTTNGLFSIKRRLMFNRNNNDLSKVDQLQECNNNNQVCVTTILNELVAVNHALKELLSKPEAYLDEYLFPMKSELAALKAQVDAAGKSSRRVSLASRGNPSASPAPISAEGGGGAEHEENRLEMLQKMLSDYRVKCLKSMANYESELKEMKQLVVQVDIKCKSWSRSSIFKRLLRQKHATNKVSDSTLTLNDLDLAIIRQEALHLKSQLDNALALAKLLILNFNSCKFIADTAMLDTNDFHPNFVLFGYDNFGYLLFEDFVDELNKTTIKKYLRNRSESTSSYHHQEHQQHQLKNNNTSTSSLFWRAKRINLVLRHLNLREVCIPFNEFSQERHQLITKIDLSQDRIAHIDTACFQGLTGLKHLILRENNIRVIQKPLLASLSALVELDLSFNELSVIESNAFADLTSLDVLRLNDNCLQVLDKNLFKGRSLSSLTQLHLQNNKLQALDRDMFDGLANLETLDLSYNELQQLKRRHFSGLLNLGQLNLASNLISKMDRDTFSGGNLPNLKTLDLSANRLSVVNRDWFQGMFNLVKLRLSGNPLPFDTLNLKLDKTLIEFNNEYLFSFQM